MPINFVTGLPRTGKTLWTLCKVREIADADQRPVYYCNIPGITIPGWIEIDHPDKWLECPDRSIIVVDELQDFWQKGATGSKVPTPILELSKHGKRGIDFYIITQEPDLVHATPRLLCQTHYYIVRAFGSQNVMIYQFERIQVHPEKVTKKASHKFPWRYKKEAFTWYKSADVHNIKRQIPWQVWAIPFMLVIAPVLVWFAYKSVTSIGARAVSGMKDPSGLVASNASGQAVQGGTGVPGRPSGRPATLAEYVSERRPRIDGLGHTAPIYDELTRPSRVAYPAACMTSEKHGCQCFTQDGTQYRTTDEICRNIVAHGLFLDFDPDPKKTADAAEGRKRAPAGPDPAPVTERAPEGRIDLPARPLGGAAEQLAQADDDQVRPIRRTSVGAVR